MSGDNTSIIIDQLRSACSEKAGILMIINVDNFELFGDVYGKEISSQILKTCMVAIDSITDEDDIKARLGDDEFVVFCTGNPDTATLGKLASQVNDQIREECKNLLGEDLQVPVGASVGAVLVPNQGTEYEDLFRKAYVTLEHIKMTGETGIAFYKEDTEEDYQAEALENITRDLESDSSSMRGAMWLNYEYFSIIYRYMRRYIHTYNGVATKVLFTLTPNAENISDEEFVKISKHFGEVLNRCLRKSDIMMQSRRNQYFLLLPGIADKDMYKVHSRIEREWAKTSFQKITTISAETQTMRYDEDEDETI